MAIGNVLRSRKIRQLDLPKFWVVDAKTSLAETIEIMQKNGVGAVLVSDQQRLSGIFTERDVIFTRRQKAETSRPVRDFMTANPATLHPDDSVFDAIQLMDGHHHRNVPLVEANGDLVGTLPVATLIDFLAESFPQEVLALPPRANQQFDSADGA